MKHKAENTLRAAIVATARTMREQGLSPGCSGNVSARTTSGFLITPSGLSYAVMEPADIVALSPDGAVAPANRTPSSEWRFHRDIYRTRADVAAIVHTHSMHATVLACAHRPIPAFHYMVAMAGGRDIPLAPYATFGSDQLSGYVVGALTRRDACLLANHGMVAVADTLTRALDLAGGVETLAEMYCKVLALGTAPVLDDAEMDVVLAKFKTYGQSPPTTR